MWCQDPPHWNSEFGSPQQEKLFSLFSSSLHFLFVFAYPQPTPTFRLPVFVCHSRLPLSSPLRTFAIVAHLVLISGLVFTQIGNPHNKNISLNFLQFLSTTRTLFSSYTSLSIAFYLRAVTLVGSFFFPRLSWLARFHFVVNRSCHSLLRFALIPIYWSGSRTLQLSVWKLFH